jgi:hypothetical protein
MTLWKKLFAYKESSCHRAALKLAEGAQKETLENACMKSQPRYFISYGKEVAKEKQSIKHFEDEINMQELNGINMGHILHSTNACINVVSHTASEIINKKIVSSKGRISLISDESTTISKKSTLILYVQVFIPDCRMSAPANLILGLIELDDVTAKRNFQVFASTSSALWNDRPLFE